MYSYKYEIVGILRNHYSSKRFELLLVDKRYFSPSYNSKQFLMRLANRE